MSRNRGFLVIGLVAALLVAGVISFYASSQPDGLEYTAAQQGFLDSAQDSATSGSPLADYGVSGVADERLSVGLAGIIGVVVVLVVMSLLVMVVKRRGARAESS